MPADAHAQVDAALFDALAGRPRLFFGPRILGALILLPGLAAFLAASGDLGWRIWPLSAVIVLIAATLVLETLRPRPITRAHLLSYGSLILLIHSVIIATTGGIESPLFPIYIPVTVVLAVAAGQRRTVAFHLVVLTVVVGAFLAIRLGGGAIEVPQGLRSGPPLPLDLRHLVFTGGAVLALMFVGAGVGLWLRSRLNRAAAELAASRAETLAAVQAQNRELSTLSSALAHELKNPLAAIQSLSGLVERKLAPGSREAEQMGVLAGEVRRLGGILDEFLNLSRPADGLNATVQDPAVQLATVVRLYSAAIRDRGIELVVTRAPCGPVRCDARKVRQVLVNLIENALDHAPAESRVTLALTSDAGQACFSVSDAGPGPSPVALHRAFEAGFTSRAEGTGLGLTVARAIARQHGGELTLAARPGGGAVATFSLPIVSLPSVTLPIVTPPTVPQALETS